MLVFEPRMAQSDEQDKKTIKSPIAEREEATLAFWRERDIFQKTLDKKSLVKDGKEWEFIFYDGPPFATGEPHYGHILAGTIKDVIPRYKTMCGFHVPRRWGWDCHGLPIENLIEKELGLSTRKDIEMYGIEKFNAAAQASVLRYDTLWKEIIPRTGRFVDMDHSYVTMDWRYTESIWWSFSELNKKELVYQELERKINFETGENTLNAAEKKELRQKELDAEKENRKETGRLKELLAKFYKQRKSDVRLGMEAKGLSSVRILPQRAPRGKPDDIRKKIPPEKISRDLKLFQAEMTQFTEFLKQEFFTSSPAH